MQNLRKALLVAAHPFAIACLLVAGCGSEQDLDGTWYSEIQVNGETRYSGQRIIVEDGTRVVIRGCAGNVDELERSGNDLSYSNGAPYYLKVVNDHTLEGLGDTGGGIRVVKRLSDTEFASGSLQMTSTTVGDLRAEQDVCAQVFNRRFVWIDQTERLAPVVLINAPYGARRVTIELPFREITVGIHPVVEFEAFVKESGAGVMPWIQSEEFFARIGNDALPIVSGSVEVRDARPASLDISGQLSLVTGEQIVFSTRVNAAPPRLGS